MKQQQILIGGNGNTLKQNRYCTNQLCCAVGITASDIAGVDISKQLFSALDLRRGVVYARKTKAKEKLKET